MVAIIIVGTTQNFIVESSPNDCLDIAKVDFKNQSIDNLQFKNGVFEEKDELGKMEWEHKITDDFVMTPETSQIIRFIKINSNHLSGSGAWDRLIGFRCANGSVNKIFDQKGLYGIKVEKRGDKQLSLTTREWGKNDPVCCPSQQKVSLLQWDPKEQTFKTTQVSNNKGRTWKTYRSEKYGFAVNYPIDGSIVENGPDSYELDLREGKEISGTQTPLLE